MLFRNLPFDLRIGCSGDLILPIEEELPECNVCGCFDMEFFRCSNGIKHVTCSSCVFQKTSDFPQNRYRSPVIWCCECDDWTQGTKIHFSEIKLRRMKFHCRCGSGGSLEQIGDHLRSQKPNRRCYKMDGIAENAHEQVDRVAKSLEDRIEELDLSKIRLLLAENKLALSISSMDELMPLFHQQLFLFHPEDLIRRDTVTCKPIDASSNYHVKVGLGMFKNVQYLTLTVSMKKKTNEAQRVKNVLLRIHDSNGGVKHEMRLCAQGENEFYSWNHTEKRKYQVTDLQIMPLEAALEDPEGKDRDSVARIISLEDLLEV